MLLRISLIALLALCVVVALTLWAGQRRWHGLAAPVARYLRQVLRDGQPKIRRTRIDWRGAFNMGQPGADRWKPFEATQSCVADPPGFVWDARLAMAPAMPALVRDMFLAGKGSMRGKVAGLITVVDAAETPLLSTAALLRHLGEAIWFPTVWLPSQGVCWEPVDESRARAVLSTGGVTAAVEFHFGANGLVDAAIVPDRLFHNGKGPPGPRTWRARILGWREFEGMKLPAQAVAEWVLDSGVHAYWRGATVAAGGDFAQP